LSGFCLILAAGMLASPAYAFLSPVHDVWQVWASQDGGEPKPVTSDPQEKIALSASPRTGELLALTRSGRALVLRAGGQVVGTLDLGPGAGEASLAPDGRRVAYTREEIVAGARERHLWGLSRGGGEPTPIVRHPGMQHSPAWSADGDALAYTQSGEAGGEDLWWVRPEEGDERQLTIGTERLLEPSVAPDGGIFVSSNRGGDYDIWRYDPETQTLAPIIARKGYDGQPRVSPEGNRILFVSGRAGQRAVWVANADGSGPRPLTDGSADVRDPVWLAPRGPAGEDGVKEPSHAAEVPSGAGGGSSTDGWLAFLRVTEGSWQPWTTRPDGSGLRRLSTLPVDLTRITLSADGRLLLADGIDGNIYLVTIADGTFHRVQVDPPGPTDAALSADGRRIAYSVNTLGGIDSNDIWVVDAKGGRAKKVTDQPFLQHFPAWGAAAEILYLSGRGGQRHDIWRVSADDGGARLVLGDHLYNFEAVISPGGDIAFSSNREDNYEIWMLPAGASEPRRLTRDPAYDGQPTFSPDGRSIAFMSRRGGASRIWILDLESGSTRPLPVEGDARMPFWYKAGPDDVARRIPGETR
jgi:TolB protein